MIVSNPLAEPLPIALAEMDNRVARDHLDIALDYLETNTLQHGAGPVHPPMVPTTQPVLLDEIALDLLVDPAQVHKGTEAMPDQQIRCLNRQKRLARLPTQYLFQRQPICIVETTVVLVEVGNH